MTKKNIYCRIASQIAEGIRGGIWTGCLPGKNLLARHYKVNPRTILKALKVLEEEGLLHIEKARGSFIRQQGPRQIPEKTVAIVETESENFQWRLKHRRFFSEIAASYGYKVVFINFDAELFKENPQLLLNYPVQGFYFRFGSLRKEQCLILHKHHIPFSCCSKQYLDPKADYVDCDHKKGMAHLIRYLYAMGHRRIAYLEFERVAEYREYLNMMEGIFREELKEDFDPELFLVQGIPLSERKMPSVMRNHIHQILLHLLRRKDPPTVIISNHIFLHYIRQELAGLIAIPEELSLAFQGYDVNDEDPFLTGVAYDLGTIDEYAFECLLKRLTAQEPLPPQQILVEGKLLIRQSVAEGPYYNEKEGVKE